MNIHPPVGTTRHEQILALLVGLYRAGGCDLHTLQCVAEGVGIAEHFDRKVDWLQATGKSAVERPVLLLTE